MSYTVAVKEKMQERIIKGESIKELSKESGISVSTLYNWKKQINLNTKEQKLISKNNKNIETEPLDEEVKKSKEIKKLIKLGKLNYAYDLTLKYPYNSIIQSQRIKILIIKKKYFDAKEIGNRPEFKNDAPIQTQIRNLEVIYEDYKNISKIDNNKLNDGFKKETESTSEEKFINTIKTMLYFGKIDEDILKKIEERKDISEYIKTILLLSICEKTKSIQLAKKIHKEAKEKQDLEKKEISTLNIIMERIKTKNKGIFDLGLYDEILNWRFDADLFEKIEQEKKREESNEEKEMMEAKAKKQKLVTRTESKAENNKKVKSQQTKSTIKKVSATNLVREKINLKEINIQSEKEERQPIYEDINRLLVRLKKDRTDTYIRMQSSNYIIQKNAIERFDKIEVLMDHLKESMKIMQNEDIAEKDKVASRDFLNRIQNKFIKLEQKERKLKQESR